MNFTNREKKLIFVLIVVAVCGIYFKFFLSPQLDAIKNLKSEMVEGTKNYAMNLVYKDKVSGMDSDIKILTQKLKDLRAVFPPVANNDEILIILRDKAKEANIDITGFSFSGETQVQEAGSSQKPGETTSQQNVTADGSDIKITYGNFKEAAGILGILGNIGATGDTAEVQKAPVENGKGYESAVTLTAQGSYDGIKSFIGLILDLKNKSALKSIHITSGNKGTINANIAISFYGIMDKNVTDYTMLENYNWSPQADAQKTDIFNMYTGYPGQLSAASSSSNTSGNTAGNTAGTAKSPETVIAELDKYDFTMSVMPYGGNTAPPSIALNGSHVVRTGQDMSMPVVYGDSKGNEKVDIVIEEKDGRFFCKYRTGHEAYPSADFSREIEFTPYGTDITMFVGSSRRVSAQDNSGVVINAVNKTTRRFIIQVAQEDKDKPRVTINKTGDVEPKYD